LMIRVLISGREVSAWFGTPRIEVQQLINQALGRLHADLGNAGYTLGGAWVGTDTGGAGERGNRAPMPTLERRAAIASEPIRSPARGSPIPSSTSGVSVYV
jgi:hypothetical protein